MWAWLLHGRIMNLVESCKSIIIFIYHFYSTYLDKDMSIPEEEVVQFARHIARRLNCYQKFIIKTVFFANTLNSLKV